ncbi:MAG: hypothetical protein AB1758_33265, partial [Candidatus Eremiobacterota bacterium]
MNHQRRGTLLGTVLLVCIAGLFTVLAFCFTTLYNFTHTKRLENRMRAQEQADQVLEYAFDRLKQQPAFGKAGAPGSTLERTVSQAGAEVTGRVTFDPEAARQLRIPLSVNNLEGNASVLGVDGIAVPAHAAHVVAVGESGGVRSRVDYLVHMPRFPYVIAASGRVQSRGGLLVASTESLSPGGQNFNAAELSPGHLLCNSPEARAVALSGAATRVTGDVRCAGGVQLLGGARVEGELRQRATPEVLQRVDLESYDPAGRAGLVPLQEVYGSRTLRGFGRRQGDLVCTGNLALENALLYVTGNLTVQGTITGKGVVVVLGQTRLEGGAFLSGSNLCAVLSRGNLTVSGNGQGRDRSFFRGLIYTEGDLTARDVTLVGALVGHGGPGSGMQLDNVNAVHDPAAVKVEIDYPVLNGATPPGGGQGAVDGSAEVVGPKLADFYDPAADRFVPTPDRLSSFQYRLGPRTYSRAEFLRKVKRQ